MDSAELHGSSWIMTRPADRSRPWAESLEALGAVVHCDPVLELTPNLESTNWLPIKTAQLMVFSSATSVRHFFTTVPTSFTDSWKAGAPQFAAVGKATAEAISENGHLVSYLGPGTGAEDLVSVILKGATVSSAVHITSDAGLALIQEGLNQGGIPCGRVEVSTANLVPDLEIASWKRLRSRWSGIIYSSPATVDGVLGQSGDLLEWIRSIPGIAVGSRTGAAMESGGIRHRYVADSADIKGLHGACVSSISAGNMGDELND
ncbi:hypothetical protein CBD41_09540 [bacterium TMED181]|nr:hypothetical protein [Planctomycetota bacterium]OUW42206.1 MAG: hypothetical protein CBD41_09540 [bacterium TMED181]